GGFAPHLGKRRGTLLCGEDHDLCQRAVDAGYRCEYRPEMRVQHWVPAERTRLRYFLRWFYWSGITNAVIEGAADRRASTPAPMSPGYVLRRLVVGMVSAPVQALSGRLSAAAAQAMDAAFALGYLTTRLTGRSPFGRHQGVSGWATSRRRQPSFSPLATRTRARSRAASASSSAAIGRISWRC